MKTAIEEVAEDVLLYHALWKAAERREARLRTRLQRLVGVAGEFSHNRAGPYWDELCTALAEAREELGGTEYEPEYAHLMRERPAR